MLRECVGGDERINFGSFGDCDVLTMHEQEERSRRKKQNAGGDHCACHRASVTASAASFYGTQVDLFSVDQFDKIDVHVELAGASHPAFRLCLGHCSDGPGTVLNYNHIFDLNVLDDLERHAVVELACTRRHGFSQLQSNGGVF